MLKKIRLFYWKQRDQGKGRQVKMFAVLICLAMISLVGLVGKSVITNQMAREQGQVKKGTSKGVTTGESVATEGAVSMDGELNQEGQVGTPTQAPILINVDTSGLDAFLGFMSENAYNELEQQLISICQTRQCTSVKKLNYQQTKEDSFDVKSFVLMSDGSIYECDYNLKSEVVSTTQTVYSEADIQKMSDQEQQAEQEAIEKQQKADQKKAAAKKRKQTKSKKKAKAKKKSSVKKTKRK